MSRRTFIKQTALGATALSVAPSLMSMSKSSYNRILGANDRIHIGFIGLGRRYPAYIPSLLNKDNNVHLSYLCDVMQSQIDKRQAELKEKLDYMPTATDDIRTVLDDKEVDAIFNATPDHWHTPGTLMALEAGKHVYVEKPCSHTMEENELIVAAQKKHGKFVQMGNQQRSSDYTIKLVQDIADGAIGTPYKAVAFYRNQRGRVPNQQAAPIPEGLNWELFQGPAPRRAYTSETWDYNWHWYGWDYGTAEAGNNATHELDIARWALGVEFPKSVSIDGGKHHFIDDGWEMYDTMEAKFKFENNKTIVWDGKSRNNYDTYGGGRGTVIYGSEGSAFVNRSRWALFDRNGKQVSGADSEAKETGVQLGGEGEMSTAHVDNFFNTIRGKASLNAPIDDAAVSMAMVHYINLAYRVGEDFNINADGSIDHKKAMKLWSRDYENGWKPKL